MSFYQLAFVFELPTDEEASVVAEAASKAFADVKDAKVSFVRLEKEAPEVASE